MTQITDDEPHDSLTEQKHHAPGTSKSPQSIDWYAPGQTRVFDVEGVQVAVRFVERKGRRGRIAVDFSHGDQHHDLC